MKKTAFLLTAAALTCSSLPVCSDVFSVPVTAATMLSPHFAWEEFTCECGAQTEISMELIDRLEELFDLLHCSKVIINSGYRCLECDATPDQHTYGKSADAVFYDSSGVPIDARIVCCLAADIGMQGISNISERYCAVHLDVRTENCYWGDEIYGTRSIWNQAGADGQTYQNFYDYWGLTQEEVYQYVYAVPDPPVLTAAVGDTQQSTEITWQPSAKAAHYTVRVYDAAGQLLYAAGQCEEAQQFENDTPYTAPSFSYVFGAGEYRVSVTAVSGLTGEQSESADIWISVAETQSPDVYSAGDLNHDGMVTTEDVEMVVCYLTGASEIAPEAAAEADLNADGVLNAKDLTLVKRAVLQAAV